MRSKKTAVGIALGVFLIFLFAGCSSGGAGSEDGGGGDDPGGGNGGGLSTALVEGSMNVSGDAEGTVSFSFEIPASSAAIRPKELKSATGMLLVNGNVGSFKIGLVGTYNTETGDYDLVAEGNLLGTHLAISIRGKLDSNRNFVQSYVSIIIRDPEGNLKVATGEGAQKPGSAGEVDNQIKNSSTSSVERLSPPNAVLSQFVGTWYGNVPSYMSGVVPQPDENGPYTRVVLSISSTTVTWRYANENYTAFHFPPILGTVKDVYNSLNSTDGSQQQHYAVEFPATQLLGAGSGYKYMNIRAKDVSTGRQMNVYLDNGLTSGDFPANVYNSAEDAAQPASRTKQRDAISFRPWK